ncbi:MAG: hypothetical protein H6739_36010 [Alphaproteobacteria bacterium]|nr:hypothetical protein [Alphaproteobacteria bacterium]
MCTQDDRPETQALREIASRASSLFVLGDALDEAFEKNAAAANALSERWCSGEDPDPRPLLDAHARLCALIDYAKGLADNQGRELHDLSITLGTRA